MNTTMSDINSSDNIEYAGDPLTGPDEITLTVVEKGPPQGAPRRRVSHRWWIIPLVLFVSTCFTTFLAGSLRAPGDPAPWLSQYMLFKDWYLVFKFAPGYLLALHIPSGLTYAALLMTILLCHEMGHYLQARRYGVPASLPFFLPIPVGPIGTLGAVIGMSPDVKHRRALFDIGITGPLAGLVPTVICCIVGVRMATTDAVTMNATQFGDPLLLKFLYWLNFGPLRPGHDVILNPVLWAGWVGLLVTSINLIPIGQLDGGHVLYAMMGKRAHLVAILLLASVAVAVILCGYYWWTLMLVLLIVMGPRHPPTAEDNVSLGTWRYILGWLTLGVIAIAFTPKPFIRI